VLGLTEGLLLESEIDGSVSHNCLNRSKESVCLFGCCSRVSV
jgi:hypothetical protein